jgi:hypothetical protein
MRPKFPGKPIGQIQKRIHLLQHGHQSPRRATVVQYRMAFLKSFPLLHVGGDFSRYVPFLVETPH